LAVVDDFHGDVESGVEGERAPVGLAGDGVGLDVLLYVREPDLSSQDVQDWGS
jgi:hypothetical protein